MNCYQHRDQTAIGTCKACGKAVCPTCAIDTGRGLACSEACVPEVEAERLMLDKGKQMYGIGSNSRLPPSGVLMYFFFGLVFLGMSLYAWFSYEEVDWFSLVMGIGFLAFGLMVHLRTRSLRINC